ncbi:DUF2130 domain-containing protein [Paracoccaceae bacterium]|nr:DUF2130 domain-containing protein [Paracoccaceae bacterium]
MVDQSSQTIECPKCGHNFSATQAFEEHIELEAQKIAKIKTSKAEKKYVEELEKARKADAEKFDEKAASVAKEMMSSFTDDLSAEKKKSTKLALELQKVNSEIEAASETKEDEIKLAISQAIAANTNQLTADFDLEKQTLLEQNKTLQRNIDGFKAKGSGKSSQLLGEAGEIYLEEKLKSLFPSDLIKEIKKGENGADCTWTIRSSGKQISSIYCEAKNTQTFQNNWVPKLKNDMLEKSIPLAILVSKAMPNDNQTFHLNDGILVCTFYEFEVIAKVLRHQQIELSRQKSQSLTKETNANQLFDYIVGPEFARAIEKILRPIFQQKEVLDRDIRFFNKQRKVREKLLQESIDGASFLAAGLEVNLGADVTNKIGFEQFELLEIIEEEDTEQ